MPRIDFDQDIDVPGASSRSQFVQLKSKGEKITFRIANIPFVRGQHWAGAKNPIPCSKVNKNETCQYCDKYEAGEIPPGVDPDKGRNWYQPNLQFLYPILNRETGEAQIFQTALSVHTTIRDTAKAGVNVYASDWRVTRNEGTPAKYYSTVRLDASELSVTEKAVMEKAKAIDFEAIFAEDGKFSKMEKPASGEEATDEDVQNLMTPPEDLPF